MKNIFSMVQYDKPSTNKFDLSHSRKQSMKMGELTPILVMETVPGDKIKLDTSLMIRMAPMVAPIMHQITAYTHYFFVPNRILWPNWEKFITGGEDGLDATVAPTIKFNTTTPDTLFDYMGLPDGDNAITQIDINALPFAAYQKIYQDYYRDQNLITETPITLLDGNNGGLRPTLKEIRTRAWQHDYFTAALPFTQKGSEATIPLGTTAPLQDNPTTPSVTKIAGSNTVLASVTQFTSQALVADLQGDNGGGPQDVWLDNSQNYEVDLTNATAASINDLRNAFRLQEWLEKNARGGSRYIESILVHFGVKSSDARLQRPEFLGGGATPISISEVLQTSTANSQPTPLANLAGHGIGANGHQGFDYFCEEHGYIIGICSVLPKTAYQQGIPKHFLKLDKFDYYWPEFAHLGEQPIENRELYFANDAFNEDTFGYTPRYAEYKYIPSTVHGEFRTSLDFWHMGRKFATRPNLNETFINADPTTRIFAVTQNEHMYTFINHRITAQRRMPFFGTPKW